MISPDFSRVADLKVFKLDKQVPLQLGTVGSRASINFGTKPKVDFHLITSCSYYFDIVNINRDDCILGTPFMRRYGIKLDFDMDAIILRDKSVKALMPAEESSIIKGRKAPERRHSDPGMDRKLAEEEREPLPEIPSYPLPYGHKQVYGFKNGAWPGLEP